MTISLPKGYELPANAKPGEPFEAVATLAMNEDGSFDLSAIDGMEIGEVEAEEGPSPIMLPWNQENSFE